MSGERSCRVVPDRATDVCGQPALYVLTFADDQRVDACQTCALYIKAVARANGTNVQAEKIECGS